MTEYDGLAAGWRSAASLVYAPIAEMLVSACPVPVAGARVLDVGSGTGAVADAAAARGARVIAVDRSFDMAASQASRPVVVGDVLGLAVPSGAVDCALAGFVVNHVHPESALRELARVVRPGGAVVTTSWAAGPDPVKAAIDAVLSSAGWCPPPWYRRMQRDVLPVSGDPERLGQAADRAGLVEVDARRVAVDVGPLQPEEAVAYRVATPHVAPWVAGLDSGSRRSLLARLITAVAPLVPGWRPAVVLACARAAQPSRAPAARSNVPA